MTERLFPINGTTVPSMLGRKTTIDSILRALTKSTPDHLQIVGSRFAGKTVILHEVAKRLRESKSTYSEVVIWDLGHQTPDSDEMFMQKFSQKLANAISNMHSNYADYADLLKSTKDNPYQEVAEVLDELKNSDVKILFLMDGFDKPLANGKLTRNLWDQLRELALKPSLRLVTASRRTLRELIRNPDAQTSDFWNIFEPTPIRTGCFNEDDLEDVLRRLVGFNLAAGAKTELWNSTNGFPIFLLEILNVLATEVKSGQINNTEVVHASKLAQSSLDTYVDALWSDCSSSSQDLMRKVAEETSVTRTGIPNEDIETLVERGFVQFMHNKIQKPNRLLCDFLNSRPNDGSSYVKLFGNEAAYYKNFKFALEKRLLHAEGLDPELKLYLQRGVEDLPERADVFFSNIRGVLDKSLDLIWSAELPKERTIPSDWISIWKRNNDRTFKDDWHSTFPVGGARMALINLMTGTEQSRPCAKYINKSIYVLINTVNAFGNLGQHREGEVIHPGTGYSGLLLCIELAVLLNKLLPKQNK